MHRLTSMYATIAEFPQNQVVILILNPALLLSGGCLSSGTELWVTSAFLIGLFLRCRYINTDSWRTMLKIGDTKSNNVAEEKRIKFLTWTQKFSILILLKFILSFKLIACDDNKSSAKFPLRLCRCKSRGCVYLWRLSSEINYRKLTEATFRVLRERKPKYRCKNKSFSE